MRRRSGRAQPAPVILVLAFVFFSLLLATDPRTQVSDQPRVISESPNSLITDHFDHQFDADRVKKLARTLAKHRWPASSQFALPAFQTSPFVMEMAFYLETAQHAYAASLPYTQYFPKGERIPVVYVSRYDYPMAYDHTGKILVVNLTPTIFSLDLQQQRTAHELFHAIQGKMIGGAKCVAKDGLWWIEATADYAACNVVWRTTLSDRMGGGVGRTYPYLLESPLTFSGLPTDDHHMADFDAEWASGEELEYDKGYFIKYLVEQAGAEFFAMNTAVLNYYRDHSGPTAVLTGLNDSLINKSSMGKTLADVYRGFAAFYLLSDKSPLVAFKVKAKTGAGTSRASTPVVGVVKTLAGKENAADTLPAAVPSAPAPTALEYMFELSGGYTAKMWAVDAAMPSGPQAGLTNSTRQIKVTALTLEPFGSCWTQVFKDKRGKWITDPPVPVATLKKTGDTATLSIGPNETLYVLATSTSEQPDSISLDPNSSVAGQAILVRPSGHALIRVSDAEPPKVSLKPITVTPSKTTVTATEIFDVAATVADAVKAQAQKYSWSGPVVTESADHLHVKMQFRPSDSGAHTISLTAQASPQDSRRIATGEATITVRPAAIAGTGSDLWAGGPYPGGFNLKRTRVVQKRRNPESFFSSPGQEVESGNVTANLAVVWMDSCPATDEELRKNVEGTSLWRWLPDHAQYVSEVKALTIDDFKGYTVETTKVVTRYGASEYQDMGFPGAGMAARGIVRKGKVCMEATYNTSGGGMNLGNWWDDMPFLKAHVEAAWSDLQGILASLKVVADGKFTTFPHPAVAVPASAGPAAAPGLPAPAATPPPSGTGGRPASRPDSPRPPQPEIPPAPSANLARGKPASQSSVAYAGTPGLAADGNTDGNYTSGSVSHTDAEREPWWQVDLGASPRIDRVAVWNRTDCCAERLSKFYVLVSDAPFSSSSLQTVLGQAGVSRYYVEGVAARPTVIPIARPGRYVRVQLAGTNYLSIAEVEVIGAGAGAPAQPTATSPGRLDSTKAQPAGSTLVLDEVNPGSLGAWTERFDPASINPRFGAEEVASLFDRSTAVRTWAKGNTFATCETKWIRRVYATGPQQTTGSVVEVFLAFTYDGTVYNLPSVKLELLDAGGTVVDGHVYFGKGIIGSFNRGRLAQTGYRELPSAGGLQRVDLAQEFGADRHFSALAVSLMNYACQGENAIVFDHLRLRLDGDGGAGTAARHDPVPGAADAPSSPPVNKPAAAPAAGNSVSPVDLAAAFGAAPDTFVRNFKGRAIRVSGRFQQVQLTGNNPIVFVRVGDWKIVCADAQSAGSQPLARIGLAVPVWISGKVLRIEGDQLWLTPGCVVGTE
jgi:hypothetical protein